MAEGSDWAALPARDALELQHDLQCGRHLGHVLLPFSGALEQPARWRQENLKRCLGGRCFLMSARTSAVVSSITSGMMIGHGTLDPSSWTASLACSTSAKTSA